MKALVVDDDQVLLDVLAFTLRREGFDVLQAADGAAAIRRWLQDQPDIIILDVNMPRMDGFEVCQRIRADSNVPILMLTVRSEEEDIVRGLDIGADDYLVKPFSPRQLVARVRAVLRRVGDLPPLPDLQVGDFHLISAKRAVQIVSENRTVGLTALEYSLFEFLLSRIGQAIPFESLIRYLWGPSAGDREMLRQLIRRLRVKIESDPSNPVRLQTVPGYGYGILPTD